MSLLTIPLAEKLEHASSNDKGTKDGEELDQVAGNAEDEIGERIAAVRETELLYGEDSLLAVYGPMLVHICGSPHKFKVSYPYLLRESTDPQLCLESDITSGSDFVFQQIPLREFAILRPEPSSTVQDSRDVQECEHPQQHRHRLGRRSCLFQHDHRREQQRTIQGPFRPGSGCQEEYADGANASHLEWYGQGQGSARRDGEVSRG